MDVTLIVATFNRSEFLIRLLNYYSYTKFDGTIIIGDSSNIDHIVRTKAAIENLSYKLNIQYMEYPGLNSTQAYEKLADLVNTPYVTLLGDDDFVLKAGLLECCEFLSKNPEYIAANGKAWVFEVENGEAYGTVDITGAYPQPMINASSASDRLLFHMRHYTVTLFSVFRLEAWQEIWRDVSLIKDRAFGSELLPCGLSVALGKVAHLDCLYLMRQSNNQRYIEPEFDLWITDPKWFLSHQIACDRLAEVLVTVDNIDYDDAFVIARKGFWFYLSRGVFEQFQENHRQSLPHWKRWIQDWLSIPQLWRLFRRKKENRSVGLKSFLKTTSPDHGDFMPFYRAVTKPLCGSNTSVE